jgi:hypothetical protein
MIPPAVTLDHLVIAARTLADGAAYVRQRLGVDPVGGGRHVAMATHNRVLKLGTGVYLEVIAVDPQAAAPDWPRWFALDDPDQQARLARRPRLVAWVARTADVDRQAEGVYDRPAVIRSMQRDALRWRFAFTADGSLPGGGVLPYLIQWTSSHHPAAGMPESGCRLAELDVRHADSRVLKTLRSITAADPRIHIHEPITAWPAGIQARIETPTGIAILN